MTATTPGERIANFLLDIKAVKFNVKELFKWSSGIMSPIYCDNRVINSKVEVRDAVKNMFCEIINSKYPGEADSIAAVATGGIPYGALVADKLKLPFIYVRSEKKAHGLMKSIEGDFRRGDKVLLIEDLISTGRSSMNAVEICKDEGIRIIGLLSIMTYGFKKADNLFKSANVPCESLCSLDVLLKVAVEKSILTADDVKSILDFREEHGDK